MMHVDPEGIYVYLARAEPCGCEAEFVEKRSYHFEMLKVFGTKEWCTLHENEYLPVEVLPEY